MKARQSMSYTPNYISQEDPSWEKIKLGFSQYSIGSDGCALTCLAMLVNGFGGSETPQTMNEKLKTLGRGVGFMDGLVIWSALPRLYPEFVLQRVVLCREKSKNAPLVEIDAALAQGQAVLVEIDRSPVTGLQNHWVVIYQKEGADYLINDPSSEPANEEPVLLAERYGSGRPLEKMITAVVWYVNQAGTPPPTDGMYVRVSEKAFSGLRLRDAANVHARTLSVEPALAYLRVLEDESEALAKINVEGQWLHVRGQSGIKGYVAAWYVDAVSAAQQNTNTDPAHEAETDPQHTPNSAETVDPQADDASLKVYVPLSVQEHGLRMRKTGSLAGSLITVLPAGTELTVLEDADAARAKIGRQGQWIYVQDAARHKGYVAGWIVVLAWDDPIPAGSETETAPQPEPDTASHNEAGPPLRVRVFPSLGRNGLRLRAKPALNGSLVSVLIGGAELTVLEDAAEAQTKVGIFGKWLHVRASNGRQGYVAAWYVEWINDAVHPSLPNDLVVYVTSLASGGLRMRSGASVSYPVLKTLKANSALTVLENEEMAIVKIGSIKDWLFVRDETGTEGYVAAWYIVR